MRFFEAARRLTERASRNVTLNRRLPARFGRTKLSVSPGAALCYYRRLDGALWRDLFEFADHCVPRGGTVWDIGANMGVFGFAAAYIAGPGGQVLAVEADTWAAELIKTSASRHRGDSAAVRVLCAAVARELAVETFAIPERGQSGSHLTSSAGAGEELLGPVRESHPVITISLDWLAAKFGAPAAIKLDVEGAELEALCGASHVLSDLRPAIFLEVYERNADEVTALLHRHRYALYDLSPGWAARRSISRAEYNTLALPA